MAQKLRHYRQLGFGLKCMVFKTSAKAAYLSLREQWRYQVLGTV